MTEEEYYQIEEEIHTLIEKRDALNQKIAILEKKEKEIVNRLQIKPLYT